MALQPLFQGPQEITRMSDSFWMGRDKVCHAPNISADITIVGGGYVGLSIAYWLTEMRPDLKIIVLERSFCGAGASGRNAGFLTAGSASFYKSLSTRWGMELSLKLKHFANNSLDLVFHEILQSSIESNVEKSSSMTLLHSQQQYQNLISDGFSIDEFQFGFHENKELSLPLKDKFFGSLESGVEYKINPINLMNVLKKKNESKKVEILESQSAFNITSDGIETNTYRIKTQKVVLALNGYFPQFHSTFNGKIVPRRAQMLAVELEEELACPHLYYDSPERVYWRTVNDRTLLIGGKRFLDDDAGLGEFEKISSKVQDGLECYLKKQLGLKKYKVIQRWSGTMGFTDHELPFSSAVAAPIETYMIGGFSGHGMGLGFGAAKDLVEFMTGHSKETFFSQFKKEDFIL